MEAAISYEDVQIRYPEHAKEIIAQLRKGKSKHKDADPSELTWKIFWSVRIEALPFHASMAKALAERANPLPEPTEDEYVDDYKSRASACLAAKKGHWGAQSQTPITDFPPEMENPLREGFRKDRAEKERINKMTPGARNAEVEQLLKQLRGPGFMEIRIKE